PGPVSQLGGAAGCLPVPGGHVDVPAPLHAGKPRLRCQGGDFLHGLLPEGHRDKACFHLCHRHTPFPLSRFPRGIVYLNRGGSVSPFFAVWYAEFVFSKMGVSGKKQILHGFAKGNTGFLTETILSWKAKKAKR